MWRVTNIAYDIWQIIYIPEASSILTQVENLAHRLHNFAYRIHVVVVAVKWVNGATAVVHSHCIQVSTTTYDSQSTQ